MNKIELFANYALRELLPMDMKGYMLENIEGTKGNTIIIHFKEAESRDMFLTLCNRYNFKTRMIIDK